MSRPKHLDLFSGAGGFSLGFEAAGFETVAFSEIEPFPCKVLEHRWPDVPNLGDVCQIDGEEVRERFGHIDVVTFGSPCQDWSVAGKRLGLEGERSSLFHEAIRVIRGVGPEFAVFENVPGIFSSAGGWDFAAVLDEMAESGAMDIAWSVLDAQWFGVPQRRRRVFVVADFRGERAGEILSIGKSLCRDTPPRREARQETSRGSAHGAMDGGVAGDSGADVSGVGDSFAFALRGRDEGARVEVSGERTSSIRGEGGSGRDYVAQPIGMDSEYNADEEKIGAIRSHQSGGAELFVGVPEVSHALTTRYGKGVNTTADDGAMVPVHVRGNDAVHALTSEGHDASEDGGGRGTPIITTPAVAFAENQQGQVRTSDVSPSLSSGGGKPGQGYPAVAYALDPHASTDTEKGHQSHEKGGPTAFGLSEELAYSHRAGRTQAVAIGGEHTTDQAQPAHSDTERGEGQEYPAVAVGVDGSDVGYSLRANPSHSGDKGDGGVNTTQVIEPNMAVRRLMPIECEKLMGWPPGWTDIPGASDSARYRACGNGVAAPVVRWIAERIREVM